MQRPDRVACKLRLDRACLAQGIKGRARRAAQRDQEPGGVVAVHFDGLAELLIEAGAAGELIALVADHPSQAHWYKYVTELPSVTQDSAAELILHICLRQAALRRDLPTLVAALHVAERHGLLDTPACHQTAQLLRRAATFAALPQCEPFVVSEGKETAAQETAARAKN